VNRVVYHTQFILRASKDGGALIRKWGWVRTSVFFHSEVGWLVLVWRTEEFFEDKTRSFAETQSVEHLPC
jgi:hypothetical protein